MQCFSGIFRPCNSVCGSAISTSRFGATAAIICIVKSTQCCDYDCLPDQVHIATALVCTSAATVSTCQSHSCRCKPGQCSQCNSPICYCYQPTTVFAITAVPCSCSWCSCSSRSKHIVASQQGLHRTTPVWLELCRSPCLKIDKLTK